MSMTMKKAMYSRAAIAVLAFVLLCMFALPMQAFAAETGTEPAPAAESSGEPAPAGEGGGESGGSDSTGSGDNGGGDNGGGAPAVINEPAPTGETGGEGGGGDPTGGEPPVDGVIESPVDGVIESPVDGVIESPVDGVTESPVDGVTEPPVDGGGEPPVEGGNEPPVDGSNEPAVVADTGSESKTEETEKKESTGSAYLMGANDQWVKYENGKGGNAIQQAVDAALKAGQNSITVVVQDGSYTGGINIDNSGTDASGNEKPSIIVNIVAHDAYEKPADAGETNGESVYPVPTNSDGSVAVNSGGGGGVKLEGGVSVQNVELILAGIYLSLKEQKENQGIIESVLGEGKGNVDINVKDADNFTYYGTEQGDSVNFNLTDVKNTNINSGDGDDVLGISTSTTANVQLDTGKTNSELNEQFANAASVNSSVTVNSGAGSDKITVTGISDASYNKESGIVSVHKGVSNVSVDAGDDADTITLKGETKLLDFKTSKGDDEGEALAKRIFAIVSSDVNTSGKIDKHGSLATVKGGAGDDLLNLDSSWELGTLGKTSLDYQGGDGKDRLHLTGSLTTGDDKVSGSLDINGSGSISMHTGNTVSRIDKYIIDKDLWINSREVQLELFSNHILDVSMSGVDTVTDELNNKATINVTIENGKVYEKGSNEEVKFLPFTDYVYDPEGDTVVLDSFSNEGCSGALLSKLHIKGQNITLGKNTVIDLPGVTFILESVDGGSENGSILIEGTVEAENIMLKLTCTDSHAKSLFGLVDDVMDPSIMDVNSSVSVIIAATASLIASRVVDIVAKSVQTNGLLPNLTDLIPGIHNLNDNAQIQKKVDSYVKTVFGFESFAMLKQAGNINFVSIKMASAVVDILGSIVADSVRVSASSEVDTSASNSSLSEFGLPFALSVINGEAGIKVSEGANIQTTTGDIYLDANSKIKVNTTASSGRLPFTVAVTVVDNKAYVDVSGGSLTSGGSIVMNATGTVDIKTEAKGGGAKSDGNNNNAVTPSDNQASQNITQLDTGKSGGFFAISVLDQEVFAALKGTAKAIAGGDISVNSTAKASLVNKAESNPSENGNSMTLAKLLKTLAGDESLPGDGGLVGKVVDGIKGYYEGKKNPSMSEEEKAAIDKKEKEKTNALGRFVNKLTGKDNKGEGVGSLVDQATTSANTGKTDSTNTVQMVGSVGVSYANNDNKAFIDTLGEVQAGGKVSVVANGEMKVETLADGSPVKTTSPAAGQEKKDGPQDQHYASHNHGAVKVDKLTNGTIYIDAEVVKDTGDVYKVQENKNFPKGLQNYDRFQFVVKASFGYTLQKDETGYYITNEYKNVMDGSLKKETIYLKYMGKDADGCDLYGLDSSSGHWITSNDNLFKAQFQPKNSITVNNSAPVLGTVSVTDAQTDGKKVYFAGYEDEVYVTINIKSGVKFTAPVITYLTDGYDMAQPIDSLKLLDKDGKEITDLSKAGDVQEDGTTNYYYKFTMPNGKVTMNVALTGEEMEIKVDETAKNGAKVWFAPADSKEDPTVQDTYEGNVGEKIKIVIQLPKVTEKQVEKQLYLVTNSLIFAGKTPVFIKDISYDGGGQYTCYVNIPAILKTEGKEDAGNQLTLSFKTTTDPNSAQKTVEDSSTALGAGLAVDVTRYNNQAYIANAQNGTINAKGFEVKANTASLDASATSKAGFVAGDVGVAGAITVHLVSANNEALIGGSMNNIVLNGGDLIVDSVVTNSKIVTNAEAAGDGKTTASGIDRDSVGVGAGIAVGVTNLVVHSQILDRVMINGTIDDMTINAGHTGTESMKASAGASGGTSAVPVLALNISGVSVLANSGKMLNNVLNLSGNAVISAANSITREITADAAAVGSGVGVGASFIIDILNDSAKAKLGRSVKASNSSDDTKGNLSVSAEAISRLKATAKSGAKGSETGKSGGSGSSGGSSGGDKEGQPSNDPAQSGSDKKDELPDDYYDGLDNLFGDEGGAELEDDEDPESLAPLFKEGEADQFVDSNKESAAGLAGLVDIKDKNDPNKSAGNVNAANVNTAFENRQKAESSEGSVQLAATMVLNVQHNEALAQIDAVDSIEASGRVAVTSRHDTDGVIMANASATNSTTGVGVAVAINTVTYSNIAQVLTSKISASELIVRADVLEAEANKTSEDLLESIKKDLIASVDDMKGFIDTVVRTFHEEGLVGYIRQELGHILNTNATDAQVEGIAQLIIQWVSELLAGNKPSFPTKEQEDKIKNQAIEYAKAIFPKLKENFSPATVMNVTLGSEGLGGAVGEGMKKTLEKMKEKLKGIKDINLKQQATGAIFSYLAGKLGANVEPEGVGPRISTSAVSGAGASNVGVAGSLAISVVNGVNKAYVADAKNGQMNVQGNIAVESLASQNVFTSAGSSVDALGQVDKNKNATDNANSTQGGSQNQGNGKSVGVGAAVALSFADLSSDAGIGKGWTITANDLLMKSKAENNVETTSIAGTDPLARTEAPTDKSDDLLTEEEKKKKEEVKAKKAMDVAADASVSVSLIQNSVKAYLAENSLITLRGNLDMLSTQTGETNTNASGFAMGNDTAVGAAVAINLAFSDVVTQLLGGGSVAGHASLDSHTDNQDDATAVALAMGAEMDRYFAKIRNAEKVEAFNQKMGDTEHEDDKRVRIENETSNKLNKKLQRASKVSDPKDEKKDKSKAAQPLSVQALKSQDVKTESTNQTDAGTNSSITSSVTNSSNASTGNAVSGSLNSQAQQEQSIHVAAAVGLNVTEHNARTEIKGNLTAGGIKANAENSSNFGTASTGAAISEASNSNSIGVAVAVSVNGNKAQVDVADGANLTIIAPAVGADDAASGIETEQKDELLDNVSLSTTLNQNSTGEALGKYGALAIAGSSSGKGGKVGLAGSLAVIVAKGTSAILLGDNVKINAGSDANVNIAASDKSKLSAAAMAATKSDGAAAGVGASFALLYAENTVLAQAGDNFEVSAKDFDMTATKQAVTVDDFVPSGKLTDYVTLLEVDKDGNGGWKKEDAHKYGMIVIQKNKNGSYDFFTNLDTASVLELVQLSSVLASVNYYASAVAGTVMERKGDTSNQKAAVAGSVSMLFNNSVTGVSIGDNAKINAAGKVNIAASSDANTRLLGGALSSSGAKTGIGLNVATAKQNEQVYALIGIMPEIKAGSLKVDAHSMSDMLVVTAAAVNSSGTSVGGGLNVVINNNSALSHVAADAVEGQPTVIITDGDVLIGADAEAQIIMGSLALAISDSSSQASSAGAVITVASNDSDAEAILGDYATVTSENGAITVSALNHEQVMNFLIAAGRSADGGAGAGTLGVLVTKGTALAGVGDNARLSAEKDITVSAKSDAKLIEVMLAAAASTDAPAVGATIMVNIFDRETGATIGDNAIIISNAGNVLVSADSKELAVIVSVAGAAASENAISGNIQVNVGDSQTYATVGSNANIKAWDSIGVTANHDSTLVAVSPTVTLTVGSNSNAVGATVQTTVLGSDIQAIIGENANLIAYAQDSATNGIKTANRDDRRKGIIISALGKDMIVAVAVSAGAGNNTVSGVVETVVNSIGVTAELGAGSIVKVGFRSGDNKDSAFTGQPSESEGELRAEADSHSSLYLIGGALSASSSSGVGATVLTLVFNKSVSAQLLLNTQTASQVKGDVNVLAKSGNIIDMVAVNFGVSKDTAANVGGNVLIFEDMVGAAMEGCLAATGNVLVQADGSTEILNFVASVSGAAANTAVSGAALVIYFRGSTTAVVHGSAGISCADLSVLANSSAKITSDAFGLTASLGGAAVSGIVNIIVTSSITEARVGYDSKINAKNINIIATDDYDLLALVASVSGGSNAVGVTAVVTVAKNSVSVSIGEFSVINASGNLTVQAVSNRTIRNYAAGVSGGASAGVGVTVMVAVIGSKLDKDSSEGIKNGFEADEFMAGFKKPVPNAAKDYLENVKLSEDLECDEDNKASDMQVGDKNGSYNGADDYRSDEFDGSYNSGSNPGENLPEDLGNSDGSELGVAKPDDYPGCSIYAAINYDCQINVAGDILVEAVEKLNVDMVTASASGGGSAGVNVGVAVVVVYSDVAAEVSMGSEIKCNKLTVRAISGREESDPTIDHSTAANVLSASGINAKAEGSSIRAIAITVGIGGTAGVSPSVAVVNLASNLYARMNAAILNANVITVKGETLYPDVLAVTGAIGIGGSAGVSASVAVVTFNNLVEVSAGQNSIITAKGLNVLSNVDNTAKAYAMSLAGGTVGVNGAVAVVTNRSEIKTLLNNGKYTITGNSNDTTSGLVNVKNNSNMAAESYIVGVSLGGVAVGLNAAVVNQQAVIDTLVSANSASESFIEARKVFVINDVITTALATVVAVSGGGVGVGGNVLLVFNSADSRASIVNMPIKATGLGFDGSATVTVAAGMDASSEAELLSATVGGVAVGLSTSYVGLTAKNLALVELNEATWIIADQIIVRAARVDGAFFTGNSFSSTATTVAGTAGAVAVGLNAAVADINAVNEAKLISKGEIKGEVNVQALSKAEALAEVYFVSIGLNNISAATAVSLLRLKQLAEADIANIDNYLLTVISNVNNDKTLIPSHAKLVTLGGGMYNASANVAVAYTISESIARAIIEKGTSGRAINVESHGSTDAKSEALNQTSGLFNGSVFVNVAYAKGLFESILNIMGDVSATEATVKTIYTANSTANVYPAASGLKFDVAGFNVNLAIARVASKAVAALEGQGKLKLSGSASVGASSYYSKAHAQVHGATVSAGICTFATNVADSQMDMVQEIRISGLTVESDGSFSAMSHVLYGETLAQVGSNSGLNITLVGGNADVANAVMSLTNKLIVENANISSKSYVSLSTGGYGNKVTAKADAVDASLSGISAALTSTSATLKKFVNSIYITGSDITGSSVSVNSTAMGYTEDNKISVTAQSSVPSFSGSLVGLDTIAATARIVEKLTQIIVGGSTIKSTSGDIQMTAQSETFMKAGTSKNGVSMGVLKINDYLFNAQADKIIAQVIFDGHMDSAADVELYAFDHIDGDIRMDDTNVGAFSGSGSVAKIDVKNQTSHVKAAGTINALNNVDLLAQANQHLIVKVNSNSVNGIELGYAKADIILYRNALVDVDGDIISQLGNINVTAQLEDMDDTSHSVGIDQDMNIDTWVDAGTYPTATGKVVSVARVTVADDSLIQALNVFGQTGGEINIMAKNEGRVMVDVYRYVDKPAGGNSAYAITDVFETVQTLIGGGVKTSILGKNVNITAQSEMDVRSKAYTVTNVNIGIFSPNATTIYRLDMDTIIHDADISAQNLLYIAAYIPTTYIEAYCISDKVHLVGYNNPSVVAKGHVYGDVTIDKNTTLKANELNLKTFEPYEPDVMLHFMIVRVAESRKNDSVTMRDTEIIFNSNANETKEAYGTKGWTQFSKDKLFIPGEYKGTNSNDKNFYYSGKLIWSEQSTSGKANASGKTDIYLGAGASGVYVNITEGGEIVVLGLDSSIASSELINEVAGVYHVDGSKILAASLAGRLNIKRDTEHNSYSIDRAAASNDLTLLNNSDKTVQLDNVNQRPNAASKPGAFLNVTQTNANADLVFYGGGDFSKGAIYVDMAGGDVLLTDGAVISAQNIIITGVGAIRDEDRSDGKLVITNSGYTGLGSDTSIFLDVAEALDLVLRTESTRYVIEHVSSAGDLKLSVENVGGKAMTVLLGEIISGGNVVFTAPNDVMSMAPGYVNITGNSITINAGGKLGDASNYLRIDSSSNQMGSVTVNATGGIYLKEASGDLYINKIRNNGSGNIALWTENGDIHVYEDVENPFEDTLEATSKYLLESLRQAVIYANADDMIRIMIQYLKDLHRIRDELVKGGDEALEKLRWEIDLLHSASNVEEALREIEWALNYFGGRDYQDPDKAEALVNGAMDENNNFTEEFDALIDSFTVGGVYNSEVAGQLGDQLRIWRDAYKLYLDYFVYSLIYGTLMDENEAHIKGSGDLLLNLQSSSGKASVSGPNETLVIAIDGKLTVTAAPGTVLKDVYLESYRELKLDPIVSSDNIDLFVYGGVHAAQPGDHVLLDTRNLVLYSMLKGDIGSADQKLIIKADYLDLLANNVYLDARKTMIVELLCAMGNVDLTVKGDLYDKNYDGEPLTGIFGQHVKVDVSGNIGGNKAPTYAGSTVSIFADTRMDVTAKNMYIYSDGNALAGILKAEGMVSLKTDNGTIQNAGEDSGIWCDGLDLQAYGEIGTDENPVKIYSDGVLQSSRGGGIMRAFSRAAVAEEENVLKVNSVLYGENIHIIRPKLNEEVKEDVVTPEVEIIPDVENEDINSVYSESGVVVSGDIDEGAVLQVSTVSEHSACPICQKLMEQRKLEGRSFVNLKIIGNYAGKLLVQLPVPADLGPVQGDEIIVLACIDGKVWAIRGKIKNGYISFITEELGPFLILSDPEQLLLSEDESTVLFDQEQLSFGGWLDMDFR